MPSILNKSADNISIHVSQRMMADISNNALINDVNC